LGSLKCPFKIFVTVPILPYDVTPDIESVQTSTISAPASTQAKIVATADPALSWVCT